MKVTCPQCRQEFSKNEALSGGWLAPKKVFGCPHCRTFFAKNPYDGLIGVVFSIWVLFHGVLAIVDIAIDGGEIDLRNIIRLIMLPLGATALYMSRFIFKKNVREFERVHS